LGGAIPQLAGVAEPLLARLGALAAEHPANPLAPSHSSFRPAQVLIYRGKIGFISPVAEFTPKSVETPELRTDLVYRLRIIIDEPGQGLRQGMPVTVHLPEPSG